MGDLRRRISAGQWGNQAVGHSGRPETADFRWLVGQPGRSLLRVPSLLATCAPAGWATGASDSPLVSRGNHPSSACQPSSTSLVVSFWRAIQIRLFLAPDSSSWRVPWEVRRETALLIWPRARQVRAAGSSPQICTKGHQRKIFVKSYLLGQWFLFYNILLSYVVEKGLGHLNLWVYMRKKSMFSFFLSHTNFSIIPDF